MTKPASAPEITIDITTEAGDWATALPDAAAIAERAVFAACALFDDLPDHVEVSLLLTDDAHQKILNRDWRGKDKPTIVLSFPGDDAEDLPDGAPLLLGDIAVAFETTTLEAQDQQKSLADHFCHLLVHGMLHLLGFDHESEADADEMEPLEIEILAGLGVDSPYPDRS